MRTWSWLSGPMLVLCLAGAARAHQDPAQDLDAIVERFEAKQNEIYDAYDKAETEDERKAVLARLSETAVFTREFRALAERTKGTDVAARAWIWTLRLGMQFGDRQSVVAAYDRLLADHLASEALYELPSELGRARQALGEDRVTEALNRIAERSPHRRVVASALYSLASLRMDSADGLPEARRIFERLAADFRDVSGSGGRTFAQVAEAYLFELDHLQVGMVAPDFEAVDEKGAPFKLSDYRGRVVVVDFWGFW